MKSETTQASRSLSTVLSSKNLISDRADFRTSRSSIGTSDCSFTSTCFAPTVYGLIMLGLFHIFLSSLLNSFPMFHGIFQLCLAYFGWEWFDLFGSRLTRNERVFFDEKNILETSKDFDFLLGPVLDDSTPGGSGNDPCCGKYPTVELLKTMVADPKQAEMQQFYKQHYGNMYNIAVRANQEAKATDAGAQSSSSTNSLQTVKPSKSDISVSPSGDVKTDESQHAAKK